MINAQHVYEKFYWKSQPMDGWVIYVVKIKWNFMSKKKTCSLTEGINASYTAHNQNAAPFHKQIRTRCTMKYNNFSISRKKCQIKFHQDIQSNTTEAICEIDRNSTKNTYRSCMLILLCCCCWVLLSGVVFSSPSDDLLLLLRTLSEDRDLLCAGLL